MKPTRIKEIITINNGLFSNMGREFPNVTPAQLDLFFFSEYGNKIVSPLIDNLLDDNGQLSPENLETVSKAVCAMHVSQWEREEKALSAEYDLLDGYKKHSKEVLTLDTALKRTGTDTVEEKAKVFGFDSADGVDDSEHKSTDTKDLTDANTGTETREKDENGYTGTTPQKQVQAELDIALWDYLHSVLQTVANETTIQIY